MSDSSLIQSSASYHRHSRQGGRRWVPKGVMLLAVLFIAGLLSACQKSPAPLLAEIAVPVQLPAFSCD